MGPGTTPSKAYSKVIGIEDVIAGVAVGVTVAVGVIVAVGDGPGVTVVSGVAVSVGVAVGVGVAVAPGVTSPQSSCMVMLSSITASLA